MKPKDLQKQINESLQQLGQGTIRQIKLAPWSDVSDLTMNTDVYVYIDDNPKREFSIISRDYVNDFFDNIPDDEKPGGINAYVTTGPLIILENISGDLIVRSIMRCLELESDAS